MRDMPEFNKSEQDEMKAGEIWVGNTRTDAWPDKYAFASDLKTLRIGEQAYDIYGDIIPPDYYRPLFIHESEYKEYDKRREEKHRSELAKIGNGPILK